MRSCAQAVVTFCLFAATTDFGSAQILYVPGGGVNNLPAIVDPTSKGIVGFLQSGGDAQYMAVTPDGARAYITDPFDTVVAVVDLARDTRIATIAMPAIPFHVVLHNDGTRAFVGVGNVVQVISTSSNSVVGQIPLPATVDSLSVSRTSPRLYVGTPTGLFVIDTTTNSIINSISTSNLVVVAITPSPDGSRLYILGRDDATGAAAYLMTVDLSLETVTGSIPLGIDPFDLTVTPDGSRIYASIEGPNGAFAGALMAVDAASGTVVGAVALPGYAGKVALEPKGSEVYVAVNEALANVVDTINLSTLNVTARIFGLWGGAHDLVFAPRPIRNYEAEAPGNILTGKTQVVTCAGCSGGAAVAGVAEPGSGPTGGSLTFTNVSGVVLPQAELSIYYEQNERSPITAAVIVNGITTVLDFPPLPIGSTAPSSITFAVPGQTIGTITITGVQGTPSSSLTIDRVTVQ